MIVLPSRVGEGLPIHFNNNDLIFRHQSRPQPAPQQAAAAAAAGAAPAVAVGAEPLPQPDDVQIAPIPADERQARYARVQARLGHMMNARMRQNQEDQQYYYDQQPPNLMVVGTAHAHYRRHMNAQAHQQQREPSWNNCEQDMRILAKNTKKNEKKPEKMGLNIIKLIILINFSFFLFL